MSRTDRILAAIAAEVGRRRATLDDEHDRVKSVSVIVMLNERTGRPQRVIYRMESQSDIGRDDRVATPCQ